MSVEDDLDMYENSYYRFIEVVEILASTPEEACERVGHFNVAFEIKHDLEAGLYLFNYAGCPLSSAQRKASRDAKINSRASVGVHPYSATKPRAHASSCLGAAQRTSSSVAFSIATNNECQPEISMAKREMRSNNRIKFVPFGYATAQELRSFAAPYSKR